MIYESTYICFRVSSSNFGVNDVIADNWTQVYNEIGVKDKERYHKELREYKEKVKKQEEANKENGQSLGSQDRDWNFQENITCFIRILLQLM